MVFLRPVIIRSKEESASLSADRYNYMRTQQIDTPTKDNSLVQDLGIGELPPLQNGAPQGGGVIATPPPIDIRPVRPLQQGLVPGATTPPPGAAVPVTPVPLPAGSVAPTLPQ
jgi:general secretion pathway protein D